MSKINKRQVSASVKASINPRVLKWAREAICVSHSDIVKKLDKKTVKEADLIAWEKGQDFPTINIAKSLAKLYGIKFITLYLPSIPKNIKPLKDFRGVSDTGTFSKNFVFLMREIQGKQEWLKEYLASKGKKPINFISSINIDNGIKTAVNSLNRLLLTDIKLKPKTDDTLKALVKKIESLGVFVSIGNSFNGHYLYAIEPSEARGFAIADKIAPFIFINSKDNKKAQLFTLIHEFCHLLLGESGVSDASSSNRKPTEIFCNKATAEFLMPTEKFYEVWNSITTDDLDKKIKILCEKFPTSSLSVIIKIYTLELIDKNTFDETHNRYKEDYAKYSVNAAIQKQGKTSFFSPYLRTLRINGRQFIDVVIEAYNSNEIMIRNACSLLGITKVIKFDTYEHKWDKYL
ncbi:MAG: ImmA/IrrE family metallo-endopeptidase [Endomicrobium sp.]|jgi:Zn-dependent peptidase ImmA (M78 family)/DNA-binding XRE family transcriptional regulator|nr:ImmA/IrrE family metallo-endopeptidase [Endomicrobium sp.]